MPRKGITPPKIEVPVQNPDVHLTESGEFCEGGLKLTQTGFSIQDEGERDNGRHTEVDVVVGDDICLEDLELGTVIGRGSSGIVQKVRHKKTGQQYALKVIQLDVSEKVRKQIVLELRTLHESCCPHVVSFAGAFYTEGAVHIVLEYMDGGSLADALQACGPLPEDILSRIACQILQGLSYLHKRRHLIHRDIKPSNILLNQKGEIKIADFGVCGQLKSSISKAASWVGTVMYMSPERITGCPYSFDSDIWSLGLSIVELATGRFPYPPPGESKLGFFDLLHYIVKKPPPRLPEGRFSDELNSFVDACLQKEPEKRAVAKMLLEHPFITKHEDDNIDVKAWTVQAVASVAAAKVKPVASGNPLVDGNEPHGIQGLAGIAGGPVAGVVRKKLAGTFSE
eukprot:Rmarinus@m.19866